MFTWRWEEAATASLARKLYAAVDYPPPNDLLAVRALLGRIFSASGGIPSSTARVDLTKLANELLRNACTFYMAVVGGGPPTSLTGIALVPAGQHFTDEAVAVPVRNVNWSSVDELASLPLIGQGLARAIVAERQDHGIFTSPGALAERVNGLGEDAVRRLDGCLSYSISAKSIGQSTFALDGVDMFSSTVQQSGALAGGDPVLGTLEALAAICRRFPSPATRSRRPVQDTAPALAGLDWKPSVRTAALFDQQYLASVPSLLRNATTSIDVCMFHIAVGRQTRPVIDELIAAVARGVTVRVILDRDRPEDPYNSNVVNARARRQLQAGGVTVHQDVAGALLHSKYLIIDASLVVIGSHNWSTGSFATFDDVSTAIDSPLLAQSLRQRFDAIW